MTLNHVHLAATSVAATQAFYERYFGFRKERDHGQGVFLRDAAGFLIALEPEDSHAALPDWFHLGFCLDSEADVLALYRKATDSNAHIVRDLVAERGEYAAFYLADPDGRRVEVSWHAR
ncbi:MAG TPA: VOC family protein [Casimicrobiaceae bacterium]|nr:VOC family protein [Casimicrobiaceae bacterium]